MLLRGVGALIVAGIGWAAGVDFQTQIQWGRRAALVCLMPAMILAAGTAAFLWFYAGVGAIEPPPVALVGAVALALALINASINALRSRQSPPRSHCERRSPPAANSSSRSFAPADRRLREEWYPWALAFGLASQVEDWSARRSVTEAEAVTAGPGTRPARQLTRLLPSGGAASAGDDRAGRGAARPGQPRPVDWRQAYRPRVPRAPVPRATAAFHSEAVPSGGATRPVGGASGGGGGGGW